MKNSLWLDREAMPPLPYMALCLTPREFERAMNRLKRAKPHPEWVMSGASATTHIFKHEDHGWACVVGLKIIPGLDYEQVAALLVHEGVHIWQVYRDDIIRESRPCSELEAYVIQRIAQNLLTAYRRQRRG